jgi:tRNA U54 and U55 pseudouridine synthase Pus10
MSGWNYLHRIEYRRELTKSQRVHEYTESVEDHGWCFSHKEEHRQAWLTMYTRACAEDFLARMGARGGTFVVTVYQQRPDRRVLVVAIRMKWAPPKLR